MASQSKKPEFRPETTEAFSEGYARLSKKASASGAGLVIFVSALILLADAFAFTLMLYRGLNAFYFAVPAAIAGVDLLFLISACFTNFRFRYAKVSVGLYIGVSVALSILFAVLGAAGNEQVMTYVGLATFFIPHLLAWGALAWASKLAETPKFSKRKWTSLAVALVLVVGVVLYGTQSFMDGTLGQGVYVRGTEKEVVFGYLPDEGDGDSYAVVGVVDGKGDTIRIPEMFHGKPVSEIDCAVFSAEEIETVYLEGKTAKNFKNLGELASANANLKVVAYPETVDAYATQLFGAAVSGNGSAGKFLRALQPVLKDDEFYVSFCYDFDSLPADARPIPIYIGKKGTQFELSALGEYARRYEMRGDLSWNYQYSEDRSRMTEISDGAGGTLIGKRLNASVENVTVGFERVYRLDRYAGSSYGGTYDKTVYATRTDRNNALAVYRKGCALSWDARVLPGVEITKIETETELQTLLDGEAKDADKIELYANWTVVAPEPTTLKTDAEGNRITYGDTIRLTAEAKAHPLGLKYLLRAPDGSNVGVFSETSEFTLRGLVPNQSGTYTVVCRATDEYDSTLYAERTVSVFVAVDRKTLEFEWNDFSDLVYDGTDKAIRPTVSTGAVGGEMIDYEPSVASVKNAGTYEVIARLKNGSEEKYRVSDTTGTKNYTVLKKELSVVWNLPEMIYNGLKQQPTIKSLSGCVAGDDPEANVSGGETHAGVYFAHARLADSETNYKLNETSATTEFRIAKRIVSIVWNASAFDYNGRAQRPSAASVSNAVTGEEAIALGDIDYLSASADITEGETNVGDSYAVVARMRASSNYIFETEARQTYAILPVALTVTANDQNKTYDGKNFTAFTAAFAGLVGGDQAEEVLIPEFGGAAAGAVNYAEGGYEITVSGAEREKFGNYTVIYAPGTLRVEQRALTVTADGITRIYDGKAVADFTKTLGGAGLAGGDAIEEVGTVTFAGSAIGAKDASDVAYAIEPQIGDSDRGSKFENYWVKFVAGQLKIGRRAVTATAVGGEKIYDGAAFSEGRIKYGELALGDDWSDVATLVLTGAGTTAVGASDSPYPVLPEITSGTESSKRGNYEIEFIGGSVVIKKRALTVSAKDKTKTYDGKAASFLDSDYEVSGLADSDQVEEVLTVAFGGGTTAIDAGEHAFTLFLGKANEKYPNYDVRFAGATLRIDPRALTVTAGDKTKIYDGKTFVGFTVTLGGVGLAEGDAIEEIGRITFVGAGTTAVGASDAAYAITPKIETSDRGTKFGNYSLTFRDGALTIAKRAATLKAVGGEKVYDGAGYSVSVVPENFVDPIETLGDVGFSGDGATAKNAGTYALSVSIQNPTAMCDNYEISYVGGSVTIRPRPLAPQTMTGESFRVSKIYDGTTETEFAFVYGTHYILAGAVIGGEVTGVAISSAVYDSPDVATATHVTLTFGALQTGEGYVAGNYDYAAGGTLVYTAEILKKEVAVVWMQTNFIYNGEAQTPNASAEGLSGTLLLTVSGGAKDAGESYRASASLSDVNYRLTNDSVAFKIAPAIVSASWGTLSFEYDGAEKKPSVTAAGVKGESVALGTKISIGGTEIAGAVGAGTYRAAVQSVDANYTVDSATASKEFTIAPQTVTAAWGETAFVYDGFAKQPAVSATGKSGESVDLTVKVTKNGTESEAVDAGSYHAAAISSNKNYTVDSATAPKEFTIAPMEVSVVWSAIPTVYNGAFQKPSASAVGAKGARLSLSVTVGNGDTQGVKNAGSYTASATLSDANYRLKADTATSSFAIAPRSVSVVWTGLDTGYDGAAKLPTAKIVTFEGEKTLTVTLTQNGSAVAQAVRAGVYDASTTFNDTNYTLTNEEAKFTIAKKKVAAVWSDSESGYDGAAHAPVIVTENAPYAEDFKNPVYKYFDAENKVVGADAVVAAGSYRAELTGYDSDNYELTGVTLDFSIAEPIIPAPEKEA